MVDNIKAAFAKRVAGDRLDGAVDQAGGAEEGRDDRRRRRLSRHVGATIRRCRSRADNAYANQKASALCEYQHQIAKIGKPMDRDEWWMPPQLVNAVNLPVQNALNFPAAILVKPFFDPNADAAFNYGAIGATIGHEISHSFDNDGALFDSTGALRNWWTPADFKQFQQAGDALADAVRRSTSRCPGLHVNGKLTLGENIADVAGLAAAYDAYKASLNGKQAPVIHGFTGDQRFFIAYAQSWATKMRDGDAAPASSYRRPRARAIPRADRAQPRRLVPGVQRPAGPEALPRARQAREDLGLGGADLSELC